MNTWIPIILLIVVFGCNKQQQFNSKNTVEADSLKILSILKQDYSTLSSWDFNLHSSLVTDNYLLIENGEVLTLEDDKEYFKQNQNRSLIRNNHFDIILIDISKSNAYVVYKLKSDYIENDTTISKNWTESAIFKKIDGQWKISLINSTPLK